MPLPQRRALGWLVATFIVVLASPNVADGHVGPLCPGGCLGGVFVTPDGSTTTQPVNGGPFSLTFNVRNVSSGKKTFTLTCGTTGGLTCVSVNPSSVTLFPDGDNKNVTVSYNTGATGGEVWLTATATGASDDGYYTVSVTGPPIVSLVAPVLTSGSRAVVRNRQPIIRAFITPQFSPVDTTLTVLSWRGTAVTSLARANRGVVEWEVDSAHWLGVGDSAEISITACAQNGQCQTVSRWAVLPNDQKPVLGFSGMPLENLGRAFSSPFGPGFSVSGAEVETGFATPPFFSMGLARSAGLVYSTRQSYPRALVPVDLELTWPAGTPDQVKLVLFDGATKLDSLTLASPTCATGSARRCRAVLQGDFAGGSYAIPTRKWLTVEAQVTSGGTTQFASDSAEIVIVDRRTTWYGSGWWPSGVLKLVTAGNDRLLIDATGAASVFRGNGDSVYLSPPGGFTTLVRTGGVWELQPRGNSAKLRFDSNGRLGWVIDQNGNQDTIKYSGSSEQVTAFKDRLGKTITFGYDGSSKLSTITDHGGRQTKITINAVSNQLTYDSIASPTSRSYTTSYIYQTYPGTNTSVLVKRIGVIADTTIVTYDSTFKRRPIQVTLPMVQDELGNSVTPTVLYTAAQRKGFGSLVSLDSVYVQLTDPRGNWTRSLMNRWGQARRTWDALGTLGRSEFTHEGFVIWSEGKVPDSSRVYTAYDATRRVVKTFVVRSVGDTLRLDSLVYDANDRIIRKIDPQGRASRLYYDANGNVIASVTPAGDSTIFWYRSDGLLDSSRAPGELSSARIQYESTWKQLSGVFDEAGEQLVGNTYDTFGRRSMSQSQIRVQAGVTTQWQWRRSETFYTVANEVDSTRIMRSDNCADPCESPPSWPSPSDTLRSFRVGHRFDRGGRDSLRIDDRGKAAMYLHDRLGRLVSRRPWTDSMGVKDSMAYDIAGNVKKTITRRGDTLTVNYDTRKRDTLSIIPGVGTLRRLFGGPGDQLTRLWFDSFGDSIGNVNPEMRWGFDQRGRLKGDTTFTGTVARATSYAYDAYERPSSTTDPLGTWSVRYEAGRGYLDTLITPYGDTISYEFDQQSRGLGPYIATGGGPVQDRLPMWNETGALSRVTHTVHTATNWIAGKYDRHNLLDKGGPPLVPTWSEQHGAGTPTVTIEDSLQHDGWERITAIVTRLNGSTVIQRDTFTFDRVGNLRTTAGAETYDPVTNRLLSRSTPAGVRYYTYDRAGNLVRDSLANGTETWGFGYDVLNRMRSARRNGVLIARYAYDVLGQRIAKRVYSGTSGGTVAYTRFVYRGGHVAFETDSAGAMGLRYTWGPGADNLLAVRDAAGNHFYASTDPLGNTRGLIRRDGSWVMNQRFGAYGVLMGKDSTGSGPGFVLRYAWTGREFDTETGLYFFRSRYYNPGARRFVQEDVAGHGGSSNLYAYGDGNPTNGRDPSGMIKSDLFYAREASKARSLASMEAMNPLTTPWMFDGVEIPNCGAFIQLARDGGLRGTMQQMGVVSTWNPWDMLTNSEKFYTGNMQFDSQAAYEAYIALRRRSYESRSTQLQDLVNRAARGNVWFSGNDILGCGACSDNTIVAGQIWVSINIAGMLQQFDMMAPVLLAHELGHFFTAPLGVTQVDVPNSPDPTEYSAFYYENLALDAFRCSPRPWDHLQYSPCR